METPDPYTAPAPEQERVRGGPWWAWLLIIGATVWIAASAQLALESESEEAEETAGDDNMALALLEFQARNLIGVSVLDDGNEVADSIDELIEAIAGDTPRQIAAVASVVNFVLPEDHAAEEALEFLDSRKGVDTAEIFPAIRRAIVDPSTLDEAEWQGIHEQIGWFGELLAASPGGPEEAAAVGIREACKQLTVVLTGGIGVLVVAGLLGGLLLLVAIWKNANGNLRKGLTAPSAEVGRILLGSFAIYLALMASSDGVAWLLGRAGVLENASPQVGQALSVLLMVVPVVVALWWARWRAGRLEKGVVRRAMGLHRGRGFFREVGAGVVGYVAMLPVVATGIAATLILVLLMGLLGTGEDGEAAAAEPISHPIVEWMAQGDLKVMVLVFVLAAVMAPLFEETMFRGAFHGALRRRWSFLLSALVTGVVFAAVHPQGLLAIPALTAMGFGFAMIREWRGSLIAPMIGHGLHNGMLVMAMWMAFSG